VIHGNGRGLAGGHVGTGAVAIVFPTMVRTLNFAADNLTQGQGTSPMGTLILDTGDRTGLIPKKNPTVIKQFKGEGSVCAQIFGKLNRIPKVT